MDAGKSAGATASAPPLMGPLEFEPRPQALLPWNAKTLKVEDFGCVLIRHPAGITIKGQGAVASGEAIKCKSCHHEPCSMYMLWSPCGAQPTVIAGCVFLGVG